MKLTQDQQDLLMVNLVRAQNHHESPGCDWRIFFGAERMVPARREPTALSNQDADRWLQKSLLD